MLKKNKISKTKLALLSLFGLIFFLFIFLLLIQATYARSSQDAIAIRIIPNPNHYSPARWYRERGFEGSPQSLTVDGYDAIRDGRTVYVGAANINDSGTPNQADDILYTNIYLISFNQEAEKATEDIFSQVISHWKFNTNITSSGYCRVNPYDPVDPTAKSCVLDSDCPIDKYCDSLKSRVVRDTKRLADLVDIKTALDNYKNKNGKYPVLSSGTYLPNITISTWPSWQKLLSQELNFELPVDPINKLGDCGDVRYHPITCWDEKVKEFADADSTDSALNLPNDSKVYLYATDANGSNYDVCGAMETDYISGAGSGACSVGKSIIFSTPTLNNKPLFLKYQLTGPPGVPFNGFISATDPDGHPLSWSIDASSINWAARGWSSAPFLTGDIKNQKNVEALSAGAEGVYDVVVTINDGYDSVSKTFSIVITATPPHMLSVNGTIIASSTNYSSYSFLVQDTHANMPLAIDYFNGSLPAGLSYNFNDNNSNTYIFSIAGIMNGGYFIPNTKAYDYELMVKNKNGATVVKNFKITYVNNPPVINPLSPTVVNVTVGKNMTPLTFNVSDPQNNILSYSLSDVLPSNIVGTKLNNNTYELSGMPVMNVSSLSTYSLEFIASDEFWGKSSVPVTINVRNQKPTIDPINCSHVTRINNAYTCQISASDTDGHALSFNISSGLGGLTIDNNTGLISGSPVSEGIFDIVVKAADQYGAVSDPAILNLTVNTYCGDGVKQNPNMEGTSGQANDGLEGCDTNDWLGTRNDSSVIKQYDCSAQCVPTGGYCGDGKVQPAAGENFDDGPNGIAITLPEKCLSVCGDGYCDEANNEVCKGCIECQGKPIIPVNYGFSHSGHDENDCIISGGEIYDVIGTCESDKICKFDANPQTNVFCPLGWQQAENWSTTEGCSSIDHNFFPADKTVYCNIPDLTESGWCPNNACSDPLFPPTPDPNYNVKGHFWENLPRESYSYGPNPGSGENGNVNVRWNGSEYEILDYCGKREENDSRSPYVPKDGFYLNNTAVLCMEVGENVGGTGYFKVQARIAEIGCY